MGGGSWSTIHADITANGTFADTRARSKNQSGFEIIRGWSFFDTSSLSGETLTAAKLEVTKNGGNWFLANKIMYVVVFSANTFQPTSRRSDYYQKNQYGATLATFQSSILVEGSPVDVTIPHANVNKTGYTQIGWRDWYDQNNSQPPSGENDWALSNVVPPDGVRLVVTTSEIPQVTTSAVTDVGIFVATGNGNVTSDGGQAITERGIVINTTGTPIISDTKFVTSGTTGVFSVPLTGLTSSKLYYARAFATNAQGTGYGSEVTFTTLQGGALFYLMQ
ncbi:MAG: hypothetical protein KAJ75_06970 [Alphaproteobacteria bacterium]|nr:hypothetical protein [Alphaproteobacteria bacterium]